MRDVVGQRGEALFYTMITRLYGRNKPLFRPQFLGDKWPTVDFIVELINYSGEVTPFFFVQVRTTNLGYTKKKNRLKIQATANDMKKLAKIPAPTYICGIDEVNELGYIVSANGESLKRFSSLSTKFPINKNTQDMLWEEVKNFWEQLGSIRISSNFIDPDWSS